MDANTLAASFPATIALPPEIRALCDWTAANGYPISGYFELREHDDETLRCWFGSEAAIGDLAQFGAGADGSLYCIWRSPDDSQSIVHLGSEGDAIFVLASNPLEFLRLLAIGYDEIGFADLKSPPTQEDREENVNANFQRWVSDTYSVSIPDTGADIVQPDSQKHADLQAWIDERCG
ncbi:MAG: hypothetical protein HKN47_23370 [Pirellulaceae bacterium]|nr:hypothetical protein [Pirellulaceae bacterium]